MADRTLLASWYAALFAGDDARAASLVDALVRDCDDLICGPYGSTPEWTPLQAAAAYGRVHVVEALLARGAAVDALDRSGATALWHALAGIHHRVGDDDRARVLARLRAAGAQLDRFTLRGHPLHWACAGGQLGLAQAIRAHGIAIDVRHPVDRTTPLHHAVAHPAVVRWLLAEGAAPTPRGCAESPLGRALQQQRDESVAMLRAAGARLVPTEHGALLERLVERDPDALAGALELGCNPDAPGSGGPALQTAVYRMQADAVATLLAHGARVNARSEVGETALDVFYEVRCADPDELDDDEREEVMATESTVLGLLMAAGAEHGGRGEGANPDAGDDELYERFSDLDHGEAREQQILAARLPATAATLTFVINAGTPRLLRHFLGREGRITAEHAASIHEVVRLGSTEMLEALLDAGVDPNLRVNGEPLIHAAADFHLHDGAADRARLLLERGARVDELDDHGWTPLLRAAAGGYADDFVAAAPMHGLVRDDVIALLRGAGARLDAASPAGTTMLHAACIGGAVALAHAAHAAGADVRAASQFLRTPLHEAAGHGHLALVRWLCELGAESGARDCAGATPLHLAITALKHDVAAELLARGAPIDGRDAAGRTPLAVACEVGLHAIVPALLARGADPNARDAQRRTPLHHACTSSPQRFMATLVSFVPVPRIGEVEAGAADVAVQGARLLLDAGAGVDARNAEGQTPLHVAAAQSTLFGQGDVSDAMCRLLVGAGANPRAPDDAGTPPGARVSSAQIRAYFASLQA